MSKTFGDFKQEVRRNKVVYAVLKDVLENVNLPDNAPLIKEAFEVMKASTLNTSVQEIIDSLADEYSEEGIHEKLMDETYLKWADHANWTYDELIDSLPKIERVAVLLGNLNYQVENGGFYQWHFNLYGKWADEIISILDDMKLSLSKQFHDVLDTVQHLIEQSKQYYNEIKELENLRENYSFEECVRVLRDEYGQQHLRTEDDIEDVLDMALGLIEDQLGIRPDSLPTNDFLECVIEAYDDQIVGKTIGDLLREARNNLFNLDKSYYEINNMFLIACEIYLRNLINEAKSE